MTVTAAVQMAVTAIIQEKFMQDSFGCLAFFVLEYTNSNWLLTNRRKMRIIKHYKHTI